MTDSFVPFGENTDTKPARIICSHQVMSRGKLILTVVFECR